MPPKTRHDREKTLGPNYRILAGVQVEGQQPRRTRAQMEKARAEEKAVLSSKAETQRQVLQRVVELETKMDTEEAGRDTEVSEMLSEI